MHVEARAGFKQVLRRSGLDANGEWSILDVGGMDVNGTVHDYFPNSRVFTLDIGGEVDIIADATSYAPSPAYDVVMSTEMFEHVAAWKRVLMMMAGSLAGMGPQVLLATCASTGREMHSMYGHPIQLGEHYANVDPFDLELALADLFYDYEVIYNPSPGDAYMWARKLR